jgi:hypothetical protein
VPFLSDENFGNHLPGLSRETKADTHATTSPSLSAPWVYVHPQPLNVMGFFQSVFKGNIAEAFKGPSKKAPAASTPPPAAPAIKLPPPPPTPPPPPSPPSQSSGDIAAAGQDEARKRQQTFGYKAALLSNPDAAAEINSATGRRSLLGR